MKPFLDPFPFRTPENRSSIGDVISEITSRGEQPKGKGYAKVEKIPAPIPPSKSGKRYDKVGKVTESHTRTQLEKLSTTQLRGLKKKYEGRVLKGDKDASRELADIRGILRAKGAGSVVDEGVLHEGGVKAALHDFMEGLPPKAVGALRPVMGDSSIRGGTLRAKVGAILKRNGVPSMVLGGSSAQIVIDNWDTFHGDLDESRMVGGADYLQGVKNLVTGKGFKTDRDLSGARVNANMARLKAANAADLKDKPGAAGKAAHKRLHKTIGAVLKSK